MFDNIYRHGFARVAVCVPRVKIAEPEANATETLDLARRAHDDEAVLALFPELGISAYTNDDLFFQDATRRSRAGAASARPRGEPMRCARF